MTETWAGLLQQAAIALDIDQQLHHVDNAAYSAKLRRLASLLEQITPEDVFACLNLSGDYGPNSERHGHNGDDMRRAGALAKLLSALSTAPTEETEDR